MFILTNPKLYISEEMGQIQKQKHYFKCGTTNLEVVSFYKYLCVIFTEHLNYEKNATILSKAGGKALGSVIAKYKTQGFMGYSTFTKLYEACITPILDYSAYVFGVSHGTTAWRKYVALHMMSFPVSNTCCSHDRSTTA